MAQASPLTFPKQPTTDLDVAGAEAGSLSRWGQVGLCVIVLLAATTYVFVANPQRTTWSVNALASLLLWISAFPLLRLIHTKRRHSTLGFLPLCGIAYFFYYGNPMFTSRPLFFGLMQGASEKTIPDALVLTNAGLLMMFLVYYGAGHWFPKVRKPRLELDLSRCSAWFAFAGVGSLVVRVATFGRFANDASYAAVFTFITFLGEMATAGLLLAHLRGHLDFWRFLLLLGLVFATVALGLANGSLSPAMLALLPLLFIFVWERGRWPWLFLLLAALFLAPLQATKQEFRARIWFGGETARDTWSVLDRLSLFADITTEAFTRGTLSADAVGERAGERVNYLGTLAYVVDVTPREVPYWEGYTYSDFLWRLVPRILTPSRPLLVVGQDFPRRYGLVDYGDDRTSYNLAQLVELYVNFGPIGIVVGMGIIGLLYRLLEHLTIGSTGTAVIGAQLCSSLMNIESHFVPIFFGTLYASAFLYGFVALLPRQPEAQAS